MNQEMHNVKIESREGCNNIIGQTFFVNLYKVLATKVPKAILLNDISIEFLHLSNV